MSTTPNMNLTLPTVSQTTGPSWASQINTAFSTIDSHSHTTGNGVAITTAALDIDDDLSFGQNAALNLSSVGLVNQVSTPSSLRLYVTGNDLWYSYDGITPVQITTGGSIAGATGNISGMSPPAAVIFDSGTGTFTFWSNQSLNQQATLVSAQLRLRASAVANPVTIAASASGSTYTLTLPNAPPGSAGLVGFSSGGVLSAVTANSTLTITSSSITVATGGVTATQLASQSVTQSKMELKSAGYGSLTGAVTVNGPASTVVKVLSAQNYVAGRPVYICLTGLFNDGSTPNPVSCSVVGSVYLYLLVTQPNGTNTHFSFTPLTPFTTALPAISGLFNVAVSGSHNISLVCYIPSSGSSLVINNVAIQAFQL